MDFSLVIPTYNNYTELMRCLSSLEKVKGPSFEVLVCVDGSTDETLTSLKEASFEFDFLVLQHPSRSNQGRSATRNLALPHARGKYVVFLDSDMECDPQFLVEHKRVLNENGTISIGGVSYFHENKYPWAKYTAQRGVGKFPPGARVPFQYFITPNTALPTHWWKDLDGFDENINQYGGEDMELGFRLSRAFHPHFVYNPQSKVRTFQPKSIEAALAQLREYGASGLRYIVKKWPELSNVYWVYRCNSPKWNDRIFEFFTHPFFQKRGLFLTKLLPFPFKKWLLNYLVISAVHEGFRAGE